MTVSDGGSGVVEDRRLAALPSLPRDEGGPVFAEPWQAQAFAMAVSLNEAGLFTWAEWVEVFSRHLRRVEEAGRDSGSEYYLCWLSALEDIVAEKRLLGRRELQQRKEAWDRAARATPHGEPIALGRERDMTGGNP